MGRVIFWVITTGCLAVAFIFWYAWVYPRIPTPQEERRRSQKWKTIVEWDTTHTVKSCPSCNGAGAVLYVSRVKYAIPRHLWEKAIWATANLAECASCWGLGYVGKNFAPRIVYPPLPPELYPRQPR